MALFPVVEIEPWGFRVGLYTKDFHKFEYAETLYGHMSTLLHEVIYRVARTK